MINRLAGTVLAMLIVPVIAAAQMTPTMVVAQPWLRATPRGAPVVGGYVTITNLGTIPDRLVGAHLDIATTGEVHTMTTSDGVMHMRRLDDGLTIAPGATLTLVPGGNHLMFLKPTAQLQQGEIVKGTLTFARAGSVPVAFVVAGMAAKGPPGEPVGMTDMGKAGGDMRGMH